MPAVGSGRFSHGGRRRPGGAFDGEHEFCEGKTGNDDKTVPFSILGRFSLVPV
jgi:hypothetical protein